MYLKILLIIVGSFLMSFHSKAVSFQYTVVSGIHKTISSKNKKQVRKSRKKWANKFWQHPMKWILSVIFGLTTIFTVLKLSQIIAWSWIWVLSPIWITAILFILLILYVIILFLTIPPPPELISEE